MTGRFSVAVVTTLPESKVRVPEVFITLSSVTAVAPLPVPDCASKLPVMSVGQRNWPIRPVIRRIASPCVEPAARLSPDVHPRKGERQGKNPFLFTMLFEKSKENLEITTWYYKSFPSALRLSELARGAGTRAGTTRRGFLTSRALGPDGTLCQSKVVAPLEPFSHTGNLMGLSLWKRRLLESGII